MGQKVVYVIGAGASSEFGLPIGPELAERIRLALDANFSTVHAGGSIIDALRSRRAGFAPADHVSALALRGCLLSYSSIDRALHARRDDEASIEIGKLAIADRIAGAEAECQLSNCDPDDRNPGHAALHRYSRIWAPKLLHLLVGDRRPSEMTGIFDDVSFIVFNYDRCLEQFIYYSLTEVYGQHPSVAAQILGSVPIIHVYGSLGPLNYIRARRPGAFGESEPNIRRMAGSLRTFTEGAENGTIERIRGLINGANKVVILGFGFDELNLRLILPNGLRRDQFLFATRIARNRVCETIDRYFDAFATPRANLVWDAINCAEFVDQYLDHLIPT